MFNSIKAGHIASDLHRSNRFLVWGGYNARQVGSMYCPSNFIYLYDPFFEKWTEEITTGDIPPGTSGAGAILVDEYLYVIGGYCQSGLIQGSGSSENTNNVYQLHLPTKRWACLQISGKKPIPADKFCVWNDNEKIYIFGGFGLNPMRATEKYKTENITFISDDDQSPFPRGWNNQFAVLDTRKRKWSWPTYQGEKPIARAAHACAKLGRKVFVSAGRHRDTRLNDIHCFDLETLSWSGSLPVAEPIPHGRSWHSLTAISTTKLILYGGLGHNQAPLNDCWIFDSKQFYWCELQRSQMQPRLWHTANFSSDNELIVLGGCTNNIQFNTATYATKIAVINISPKSLLRLCLDEVVTNNIGISSWKNLPKILRFLLDNKNSKNEQ